ncbi:hydrogenase 4 Fe-S subunit [Psychromonas sp. CNPT3]|uniref:4Fe-4S dicluster domain-containing protein n=1 Tax=Psychromonas sp. CNPT3 TaxID=314282 RepID=UPI00006E8919|nr:hydrogenase 4 Fe-S subunit [Psychromonas sp. CNPT3]
MNRFVIADPKLCIGCDTCMAACSTTHKTIGLQAHPRLTVTRNKDATAPVLCRHCEDAPCATVCPVNAITHVNGSIHINESLCIGCTLCSIACPFGAITFSGSRGVGLAHAYDTYIPSNVRTSNPTTSSPSCFGNDILAWEPGVKNIAVKCDLCAHLEGGPACIEACPTKALFLVDPENTLAMQKQKRDDAANAGSLLTHMILEER